MALSIRPIDPVSRPFFAGEVSGIDITRRLTPEQAGRSKKGMDQYGVLVFHGQHFDDETQLAFSRNFGALEEASGDLNWGKPRRLEFALVNDISNLDINNQVLARDNRKRLFSLGNVLWHSDSRSRRYPAKFSLLSARSSRRPAATLSSPTCAPHMTRSTTRRKPRSRTGLRTQPGVFARRCWGSRLHRRGRVRFEPVLQRLVRTHPRRGGNRFTGLAAWDRRLAGAGGAACCAT